MNDKPILTQLRVIPDTTTPCPKCGRPTPGLVHSEGDCIQYQQLNALEGILELLQKGKR